MIFPIEKGKTKLKNIFCVLVHTTIRLIAQTKKEMEIIVIVDLDVFAKP